MRTVPLQSNSCLEGMIDSCIRSAQQRRIAPWPGDKGLRREGTDVPEPDQASKARIHTPKEWQTMYMVIRQLYVIEHRKLSEVMTIMEQQFGFKATEQMYKKRFTAWGLAKNRKRVRPGTGDTAAQVAQGDMVHGNSVAQGWQSRMLDNYRVAGHIPTECALHSIYAWANGNFDGTQWLQTYQQLGISSPNGPVTYPSTQMYQDMALSQVLLARRQGRLAGLAVRKAFRQLENVIHAGDPGMMRNLVDVVFHMIQSQQFPLVRMLFSQLASLASHQLPKLHPLTRYFQELAKHDDDIADALMTTYRCFVESFLRRVDDGYYWMYDNWVWDSSVRGIDTDPEVDYEYITKTLQTLALTAEDVEPSAVSRSHLGLLKDTEFIRRDGFEETSAASILRLLEREEDDIEAATDPIVGAYMRTATIKRAICREDWPAVRRLMDANIERLETAHGCDSREVIRELWSLEKVMRKAGNDEAADLVSEDALRRIDTYLSEVPDYIQ
ncbi:putative Clr5 domain-containing protein [Seiridium cardinale]|uniref:Clr5 domain-containing protein n=1 Tax=Seiridium cardinale TaxID=138064 RepID=A0ABR2Y2S0_9PEZI